MVALPYASYFSYSKIAWFGLHSDPFFFVDLEETAVTFRDALITMVHDPDHHVRMFIARTVPIVYLADPRTLQLVSSECQCETFEKVSGMLQKAHQVLVRLTLIPLCFLVTLYWLV